MLVSENELQEIIWRAFRGFGWPRAESKDIADAIVWLEMHDLDGMQCLQHCIENRERYAFGAVAPASETDSQLTLDADNSLVLLAGDMALNLAIGKSIETGQPSTIFQTHAPVGKLALAHLDQSAVEVEAMIRGNDTTYFYTQDRSIIEATVQGEAALTVFVGHETSQLPAHAATTAITQAQRVNTYHRNLDTGLAIDDALWTQLETLAIASMVEATDESRARGAGENAVIG